MGRLASPEKPPSTTFAVWRDLHAASGWASEQKFAGAGAKHQFITNTTR
jgi:hypothetical protein